MALSGRRVPLKEMKVEDVVDFFCEVAHGQTGLPELIDYCRRARVNGTCLSAWPDARLERWSTNQPKPADVPATSDCGCTFRFAGSAGAAQVIPNTMRAD